jgi:hypothetical protein
MTTDLESQASRRFPFRRLLGIFQDHAIESMFVLNAVGSGFWIMHGLKIHMPTLFIASAVASVVSSGLLGAMKADPENKRLAPLRPYARLLHNVVGVPTVVAGLAAGDSNLIKLGAATIGGSLCVVWGDDAVRVTKSVLRGTKLDRLMQVLKLDKIPALKTIQPTDVAFVIYALGVIPTVFKDAKSLGSPWLAAAGACYTLSIVSMPFRRSQQQNSLHNVLPSATPALPSSMQP